MYEQYVFPRFSIFQAKRQIEFNKILGLGMLQPIGQEMAHLLLN